jgi:hypothetical protein
LIFFRHIFEKGATRLPAKRTGILLLILLISKPLGQQTVERRRLVVLSGVSLVSRIRTGENPGGAWT